MLAAFYTRQGRAREVLRVDEVNTPTPGPGEVRVRLCASGINPADVKRRAGSAARQMVFPIVIPHNDGAGVIDAVAATLRMGARACLAGGEPGFADAAAALAAPQGFDHIIDVDFAANCDACTRLLARDGSVVAFGSASQMSPDIDVLALQKHGVTLHFVSGAGQRPAHQALAIQDLNQALAEGRLEVRMDSAYGLQEIALAHERVESSGLAGKVLVRVEPCVGAR